MNAADVMLASESRRETKGKQELGAPRQVGREGTNWIEPGCAPLHAN